MDQRIYHEAEKYITLSCMSFERFSYSIKNSICGFQKKWTKIYQTYGHYLLDTTHMSVYLVGDIWK